MKIETWNGHEIRFVEIEGEWWAIASDVTDALNIVSSRYVLRNVSDKYKGVYNLHTLGGVQEVLTLNEKGVYRLIMRSNKPEAEAFQDWVFDIIKQLRESNGLAGFEVFKMLDKEHQKEAMTRLQHNLSKPNPKDYVKANTIANKGVSILYGFPKMIKKADMEAHMLPDRERLLDETVNLMIVKEKYNLDIHVSKKIYESIKKGK